MDGRGKFSYADGYTYMGEYKAGLMDGRGTFRIVTAGCRRASSRRTNVW